MSSNNIPALFSHYNVNLTFGLISVLGRKPIQISV